MATNAIDLTTLANAKAWLGLTDTDADDLLQRLITAVSSFMQAWLNRTIAVSSYTETLDGNGKTRLMCSDYPVVSVGSVSINGQTIGASPDLNTPGYYFDQYRIGLRCMTFARGESNVVIQYQAGYAAVPPDLEQACIETLSLRFKERDRIGHQSKSLSGETVSFTIVDFPKSAQAVLNNYKKVISTS